MVGRVISTKLKNTVTVLVNRVAMDPLYKKTFIRSKKYLVEGLEGVKEGDIVEIINCKPISGKKNWRIVKLLGKNLAEITEEKLKAEAEKIISEVMPEKEELSVLSSQLSDKGQSVVGPSVTEKQKTDKPESENRKQKTDNRRKKESR